MDKISFKEDSTMTWQNGKPIILHKYSISKELIDIIENENNFNTINHALHDLHVEHMIDGSKSVMAMPIQDYQTQTSVIKAFEDAKNKHDRLIVLFQRLLECAKEAKKQEQKSVSAKKDEHQCSEDHEGMYYQKDGTFQKERNAESIGFCIISNYKEDVIMSLGEELVEYKSLDKTSLPSYLEMITAFSKFKEQLYLDILNSYWVNTNNYYINTELGSVALLHSGDHATLDSNVKCLYIGNSQGYRANDYYARIYRKTWRISKV